MITLQEVSKSYGPFQVLKNCSTSIERGEVVVVCGPSGSGKSTLIKCVNGLEPFDSGTIMVNGIDVGHEATDLPRLRAKIGMVFQNFELFPHLTILQNIMIAQEKVHGRPANEAQDKSMALLERVGLVDQAKKYPTHLSGGQRGAGSHGRTCERGHDDDLRHP